MNAGQGDQVLWGEEFDQIRRLGDSHKIDSAGLRLQLGDAHRPSKDRAKAETGQEEGSEGASVKFDQG